MKKFNVLMWDFNHDELIHYDILPYFRNCYKERIKKSREYKGINENDFNNYFKVPKTLDEFKKFIENESRYQFWSRCEYEMICHGWPVQKNDYKLDVHEQVMMNINIIAEILYDEKVNNDK